MKRYRKKVPIKYWLPHLTFCKAKLLLLRVFKITMFLNVNKTKRKIHTKCIKEESTCRTLEQLQKISIHAKNNVPEDNYPDLLFLLLYYFSCIKSLELLSQGI